MIKNLWPVKIAGGSTLVTGRATGGTPTTLIDTSKNFEVNALRGKYIKVIIDGVEYVREITANTANTHTFAALVAAVAATAVIEKTGAGKVTITAVPEGTYANDYQVVVVQGEGASAETTAVFEDGVLTITLGTDAGTAASASIGTGDHGVVTITCKEVGDVDYSVIVSLSETPDFPLTATLFADGTMYITLGTDENGYPDATKNTAALIAALINGAPTTQDVFTAAASGDGSGVFSDAIPAVLFEGGVDPVINATAADVASAVDDLEEFSAAATTPGLLAAMEDPVQFVGGVDEVKPIEKTEYCIVEGSEKFTDSNPATVKLSGSNAIKGATANVTTATTRVQLPDYACREVTVIAKDTNTGYIYVGGSDVSSAVYGAKLAAKDSITLVVNNTNLIYIDSSVNGEGISYVAI